MSSTQIVVDLPAGERMSAYLALPDGPATIGVVLLQEIFGVNASMRAVADDLAAHGVAAIVPDLYWRQEPNVDLDPGKPSDSDRAMNLMNGMDQEQAAQDALGAVDHLRGSDGGPKHVGAVGYCIGGKLAYLMAMRSGIDAAVSYYGIAIYAALDRVAAVRVPLLLHLGEDDKLCPPRTKTRSKPRSRRCQTSRS